MNATLATEPSVAEYAAAVRAALADLPSDEVEDLTDGLEADLAERAEDPDASDLGDPAAYADELRAAAGLAPRGTAARPSVFVDAARNIREEWTDGLARVRRSPRAAPVLDFLVTLRPVWWVLRGWAAWMIYWGVVGHIGGFPNLIDTVILLALVVVSVQVGRRKWLTWGWARPIVIAGSILLAILSPFMVGWAINGIQNQAYASVDQSYDDQSGQGLSYGGNQVGNIFAFDAQGNPLTGVQLYDQDGKPLNAVSDPSNTGYLSYTDADGQNIVVVPSPAVPGRPGWNVYPLSTVPNGSIDDSDTIPPSVTPIPGISPFATVQPLAGGVPAPSSTTAPPTATPTPSPTHKRRP